MVRIFTHNCCGFLTMKVDVVYLIEHIARELDIACAVKCMAESRHRISVEIRSIAVDLDQTLTQLSPQIVALPYCGSVRDTGLEKVIARWPNARYINLSFEQLLGEAQKKSRAPRDDLSRNFTIHHAWGEFFARYLKQNKVEPSHIVLNGNPSYALYQPPYQNYYGNPRIELAKKFGLDPEKRWVFIPENYGWAFFRDKLIRDRIRRGFDPEHAYQYRDFALESMRTAAKWWYEASNLEGIELIVRPRPAIPKEEFIKTVQEMVGPRPNRIHFIKVGSVREWILASDIIFSSYSTTLLEAAVAHKPLGMLVPHPFPDFLYSEWYDLTDKIETREAFIDVVQQTNLPENWVDLESWVVRNMMDHGDPIAGLAEILASMVRGELIVQEPQLVARELERLTWNNLNRQGRKFGWNVLQKMLAIFGMKTESQAWNPHETDLINSEEVESRVQRWKMVLG